jgi:hypothetical protein
LRDALRLALVFAAIKLVLHVAANVWEARIGYGYFGDELYYLMCARKLAWGYVDHGPGVALQAMVAVALFGKSLAGIRMLSAAAGAGRVFLTGVLAWSLGGRRPAQGLAMIGVLVVPEYLGADGYLSMNSFESVFWMGCVLALIAMVGGRSERWWMVFGVSAGLGLLNKPSMAFFLVALLVGLMLTAQRRLLVNRWAAVGVAVLLLIALPNLLWQIQHGWPTLEFLRNGPYVYAKRTPLHFLARQIVNMQPLAFLIWGAGLVWLLRKSAWRWLGVTYLLFVVLMMVLHAKEYYLAPIYPVLFAAGGVAWEMFYAGRRRVVEDRVFAFPVMEWLLLVACVVLLPLSLPLMTPAKWVDYVKAAHLYWTVNRGANLAIQPLPEFYADRFGWQEEADEVGRVYRSLSPEDRKKVGILCDDYGQASGVNMLGAGLPFATSGHNSYFLWGPHGETGEVMILVSAASTEEVMRHYESVEIVGRTNNPYSMPAQRLNIYLARGRRASLVTNWAEVKHFD